MNRPLLILALNAAILLHPGRRPPSYRQELAPERKQVVDDGYLPIFSPPAVQAPSQAPVFDASTISADEPPPAISGTPFPYEHKGDAHSPARSVKPLTPWPKEAPEEMEITLHDVLEFAAIASATHIFITVGSQLLQRFYERRARSQIHLHQAEMN
ncbi:hypothetical protein HPP92_013517 [Vanilla planifolia]|uniref:Uncharacterized protein n=1 Tax=Vanilla planifolia TaxID=51239 RepID=A0A835QVR1_VANPL|nr:hypothetical protein HPP92_013968 [Vanilla planifolia]KAG0478798.1 hypothetical protein HPP92_013517 [Vanilla planifolia]